PANPINSVSPATIGFAHFSLNGDILDLQLSALQKAGKVNILSRPSIATLDNNRAIIESGVQVPYQTVEDNEVKVEYKDAVLRLTVTPHVISDEMIRLDIEAKKDEVDMSRSVLGNPYIIKKLAQTQLIVKNGETVVIAGLSKEKNSNGDYGVPGLKNLPGLGWLFKNDARSRDFEELLIFITPKILSGHNETATISEVTN
ncbi:MAG: type IV pilus secretin PilQ, partial [Desulfobulbaceae bacterium]|nr:type IV pilus secretin PilQ [Desulfobulbaceae bacterium]